MKSIYTYKKRHIVTIDFNIPPKCFLPIHPSLKNIQWHKKDVKKTANRRGFMFIANSISNHKERNYFFCKFVCKENTLCVHFMFDWM